MSRACETYEELFSLLGRQDEQGAAKILRDIRHGQSPGAVLALARNRGASSAFASRPDSDAQILAAEAFLVSLAHSTASLKDVVRLAMSVTTFAERSRIPSARAFHAMRNRIVHLRYLEAMVRIPMQVNNSLPSLTVDLSGGGNRHPSRPGLSLEATEREGGDADAGIGAPDADDHTGIGIQSYILDSDITRPDQPLHLVTALPWTNITTSDHAVSHLVSLFLAWINPTWRFVEEDLFLQGWFIRAL